MNKNNLDYIWKLGIKGESSQDELISMLETEKDFEIKNEIIFALSKIETEKSAKALFNLAYNKKEALTLRKEAATAIETLGNHEYFFCNTIYNLLDEEVFDEDIYNVV